MSYHSRMDGFALWGVHPKHEWENTIAGPETASNIRQKLPFYSHFTNISPVPPTQDREV